MAEDQVNTLVKSSLDDDRRWNQFKSSDNTINRNVTSFYVFPTQEYMNCNGGIAAFFVTRDDVVYGVGHNCSALNILGFSRTSPAYLMDHVNEPTRITDISEQQIKDISIGGLVGAALFKTGRIVWWGNCYRRCGEIMTPHTPRVGKDRSYAQIACGHRMMCALSELGDVYVWGEVVKNNTTYLDGVRLAINSLVKEISCGYHHMAILDVDGLIYTWGRGNEGQCGAGSFINMHNMDVKRVYIEACTSIKCGPYSTFCLTETNHVAAWGTNFEFHLGTEDGVNGKTVRYPSFVPLFESVKNIGLLRGPRGAAAVVASTSEGGTYTWGVSEFPELTDSESLLDLFARWVCTPGLIEGNPFSFDENDITLENSSVEMESVENDQYPESCDSEPHVNGGNWHLDCGELYLYQGNSQDYNGNPLSTSCEPRFYSSEPHFNCREPHFNGREPHFNGREPHFNGREPHFNGREPHFNGREPHFNGREPHINNSQSHFHGNEPHFYNTDPNWCNNELRSHSGSPHSHSGSSISHSGSSHSINYPPHSYSGSPHSFNGPPHPFSGSPHSFNGPPHPFSGSPHLFNGPPHPFSGSPPSFNGPPHLYGAPYFYNRQFPNAFAYY